jgi:hypothetical protein
MLVEVVNTKVNSLDVHDDHDDNDVPNGHFAVVFLVFVTALVTLMIEMSTVSMTVLLSTTIVMVLMA